jgi:hypothetical protein
MSKRFQIQRNYPIGAGRTSHSGNAANAAEAFTISHTKCEKEGALCIFFVWNAAEDF